jgi:hypothetical protein
LHNSCSLSFEARKAAKHFPKTSSAAASATTNAKLINSRIAEIKFSVDLTRLIGTTTAKKWDN